MLRQQKLKVYQTPIGFHDAYVAARSQKAALKAWGADVDLFARGAAEVVTDEKLTKEPLDKPGTVIRRLRGTSDEHMAALPEDKPTPTRHAPTQDEDEGPAPRTRKTVGRKPVKRAPSPSDKPAKRVMTTPVETPQRARSSPRPSRARLDKAEQALENADAEHSEAIAEIREREKELQHWRRDLESRHEKDIAKLQAALKKARESYGAALEKWRG